MKIDELFNGRNLNDEKIQKPFIIAEVGVNHECNMVTAKKLITQAKEGGADAVKFQTYKADTIALKNSPAYWDMSEEPTTSQYMLFKKYDNFWKSEMQELKQYCDEKEIEFMSTPFDEESALFLNEMMNVFKISSSDITNKPFIKFICDFDKPIILSTGASNLTEIKEAVSWIEENGNPLALLHCVLNYPTADKNANLGMILDLKTHFPDKLIGYSDHTLPNDMKVCETAVLLGSKVIEKHFTHDKTLPGNDHYHSMDKSDLLILKSNIGRVMEILGQFKVDVLEGEQIARDNARRSLVTSRKISKGQSVLREDLTFKRPAHGISPKFMDDVIGKIAAFDLNEDIAVQWDMFE
jgi:sialic acid synthase SpsE